MTGGDFPRPVSVPAPWKAMNDRAGRSGMPRPPGLMCFLATLGLFDREGASGRRAGGDEDTPPARFTRFEKK